jgi:hypothetical protein
MSAGLLQIPLVTLLALSPASAGLFFGGEQTGAYQHCLRSIVDTCCVRVMTGRCRGPLLSSQHKPMIQSAATGRLEGPAATCHQRTPRRVDDQAHHNICDCPPRPRPNAAVMDAPRVPRLLLLAGHA